AVFVFFFFSSRRRHTRFSRDWSSDVCSSDLIGIIAGIAALVYLIVRLLGMDAIGLFSRKSREAGLPFSEHPETIHGIDFAAALRSEERRVGKECRARRAQEDARQEHTCGRKY